VQVTVRDNGIGIHPDALPHIFDRFYRVDPTRSQGIESGSGLGLSICTAIVANHHGDIHVDSEPQKGTTVRVALPAVTVTAEKS
jgi:OmpR-family two-component system manganese-sensing sensor histidine kinase